MSKIFSINLGGGGAQTIVVETFGDLPISGTDGQLALVQLPTPRLYVYDNGMWVLVGGQGNLLGNAGSTAIASAQSQVVVVFNTAMSDTSYSLVTAIQNVTDVDPIYLQIVSVVKSTTGFTALFNAPTDSSNYVLNWQAAEAV